MYIKKSIKIYGVKKPMCKCQTVIMCHSVIKVLK